MDRQDILKELESEIEKLAEYHILYRMENSSLFDLQKDKIRQFVNHHHVSIKEELDPVTKNLYRRYFA